MAIFTALFSFISRRLSQLLRAVFGWSITGLFGRLPEKKQTALSGALLLSLFWPLLVVGAFVPSVAAWAVAFVPLQRWVPHIVLRIVWIALAVLVPPLVGTIASWVAPEHRQRGSRWRTALHGYPITLGFALSFLITLFVVPALKLAALARGWRDEHVYLQVHEGKYREVLHDLQEALALAGIETTARDVPAAMQWATRVLKWFSRGGLDPVVADEPQMLVSQDTRLYLYPADLLIRGPKRPSAHARAAVIRELLHAPAHLVTDPSAQQIEDQLGRMWAVVARKGEGNVHGLARSRVDEIGRTLDRADIPYDDWVLLYLNVQRLERAVTTSPSSPERALHIDEHNVRSAGDSRDGGRNMIVNESRPDAPTGALIRQAMDEARDLIKTEVDLAKNEVRQEVKGAARSAIAFGVGAGVGVLAIAVLLVAFAIGTFPHVLPSLIVGIVLLVLAGVAIGLGIAMLPKKPLEKTRGRIETDVQVLKERLA